MDSTAAPETSATTTDQGGRVTFNNLRAEMGRALLHNSVEYASAVRAGWIADASVAVATAAAGAFGFSGLGVLAGVFATLALAGATAKARSGVAFRIAKHAAALNRLDELDRRIARAQRSPERDDAFVAEFDGFIARDRMFFPDVRVLGRR